MMRLAIALLIALQLLSSAISLAQTTNDHGLRVVVTVASLLPDVKSILCKGDEVFYIAPPGVDPHSYQLTPSDIEKILRADVVVSTGHTPFEYRIRDLCKGKCVLVEIPRIPGIRVATNPDTNQPNLHMPIYDPYNLEIFVLYLANVFAELRPSKAMCYYQNALNVVEKIASIVSKSPRLDVLAVGDLPPTQYAVEWLGIRIMYLAKPEPQAPSTGTIIDRIENAIARHVVKLIVVINGSRDSSTAMLLHLAERYGLPVVRIPPPLEERSFIDKVESIVKEVKSVLGVESSINEVVSPGLDSYRHTVALALALMPTVCIGLYLWVRRT